MRTRLRRQWLLVILLALLVIDLLLAFLVSDSRSLATDLAIAREIQEPRGIDAVLTPLMVAVSAPGYLPWRIVLFVPAVAIPLLAGAWRVALLIDFTLIADLVTYVVKSVVGRPRPTLEQVLVYGHDANPSFPSGHVVQYVVFFGVLAYLSWEVIHDSRGVRRILGGTLLAVCIGLIGLVGPSRVYLGAHWPTDVIGGYLIGAGLLLVLIAVDRRWLRPQPILDQPPLVPGKSSTDA